MRTRLRSAAGTFLAATVAGLVLVAVFGSAASAGPRSGRVATAGNPVVPAGGTVAGKGYAYWLERSWRVYITVKTPAPCLTVSVGGARVAMLLGPPNSLSGSSTCSEPAGRAMYVPQVSWVCSTVKEDLGTGATPADLEKCARGRFESGTIGVPSRDVLDGHPIDWHKLVTATDAFYVSKPVSAIVNAPAPAAYVAAYGSGLLLRDLPKGTHTIHFTMAAAQNGGQSVNLTYTIHVS